MARYGWLGPAVVFSAAVALVPVLYTVWLSFHRELPVFQITEFVGIENYRFLVEDARFWAALGNTAYFLALSVPLELVLGVGIALLLHRSFPGRGVVRALVLIPWAVPNVVAARFWEWIFNADFGVLNYLLGVRINWLGDPAWASTPSCWPTCGRPRRLSFC